MPLLHRQLWQSLRRRQGQRPPRLASRSSSWRTLLFSTVPLSELCCAGLAAEVEAAEAGLRGQQQEPLLLLPVATAAAALTSSARSSPAARRSSGTRTTRPPSSSSPSASARRRAGAASRGSSLAPSARRWQSTPLRPRQRRRGKTERGRTREEARGKGKRKLLLWLLPTPLLLVLVVGGTLSRSPSSARRVCHSRLRPVRPPPLPSSPSPTSSSLYCLRPLRRPLQAAATLPLPSSNNTCSRRRWPERCASPVPWTGCWLLSRGSTSTTRSATCMRRCS